jgi:Hypervirulence associated proteins TUDOR domain
MSIRTGTVVRWQWSGSSAEGKVVEIHHERVTRTIAGSEITRNGSADDPAYLIEQDDGARVLKLGSEVERA